MGGFLDFMVRLVNLMVGVMSFVVWTLNSEVGTLFFGV